MKFFLNILVSLFLFTLISACDSGGGSAVPIIPANLSASSTTIALGDSADLTAEFTAGGTGSIDNGVGVVSSGTPVSVSPSVTTTYTLTVTKSDGSTETATLTVTVVGLEALSVIDVNLDQTFQANQPDYTASVGFLAKSIQLKAIAIDPGASITVNNVTVGADNLSQLVALAVGTNPAINIVVTQNTVSKSYSLVVTRALAATFAQQAYIKASNTGDNDEFGYSVALSGDTLAVGSRFEDSSLAGVENPAADNNDQSNAGAVYVFIRNGATWTQQAYIKSSNPQANDNFGISVALYGDTLAVGAPNEISSTKGINTVDDDSTSQSGAVYVFTRSGVEWSQQAYIKASNAGVLNTGNSDKFGASVSLYGDTLAVGAINEDSSTTGVNTVPDEGASNSGAAYVFIRNGDVWTEQAFIKASNTQAYDNFGTSVAVFEDTLAVGALGEDNSTAGINPQVDNDAARDSGAVYVYTRTGGNWTQQAYIKSSDPGEVKTSPPGTGDEFGVSIALSGNTLAVGARLEDSNSTGVGGAQNDDNATLSSGAVYVFVRSNNTWSEQAFIKASNSEKGDNFGHSVALSGDMLAVGAIYEDSSTTGISSNSDLSDNALGATGAIYLFRRDGTSWSQQYYIKAFNTGDLDEFGNSVALSGDTLAVGAHLEDSNDTGVDKPDNNAGASSGAVYVFE